MKKRLLILYSICLSIVVILWLNMEDEQILIPNIGDQVAEVHDVPIYFNGLLPYKSQGRHYAKDGYYYGKKYQCVEFVKRYLYQVYNHEMPNVYGNAIDFFDKDVPQAQINKERNMVQYKNGNSEPPLAGDAIVMNTGKYGHIAIVIGTSPSSVTIAQQNVIGRPVEELKLSSVDGNYHVKPAGKVLGWLRVIENRNPD